MPPRRTPPPPSPILGEFIEFCRGSTIFLGLSVEAQEAALRLLHENQQLIEGLIASHLAAAARPAAPATPQRVAPGPALVPVKPYEAGADDFWISLQGGTLKLHRGAPPMDGFLPPVTKLDSLCRISLASYWPLLQLLLDVTLANAGEGDWQLPELQRYFRNLPSDAGPTHLFGALLNAAEANLWDWIRNGSLEAEPPEEFPFPEHDPALVHLRDTLTGAAARFEASREDPDPVVLTLGEDVPPQSVPEIAQALHGNAPFTWALRTLISRARVDLDCILAGVPAEIASGTRARLLAPLYDQLLPAEAPGQLFAAQPQLQGAA